MKANLAVLKDYVKSAGSNMLCRKGKLRTARDVLRGAGWTERQVRDWFRKEGWE